VTVILGEPGQDLNPYSQRLANRQVGSALFSGLFRTGSDLMPVADLCSEVPTRANGGISADGRTVTYRLRPDRTWHDGTRVTARDVVFTIEQQRTGALVDEAGVDLSVIESVDARDETTVVVRLSRPSAPLVWRLAPYVVPVHLLGDSGDLVSDPYWLRPIGSGPYRIAEVVPGASVLLEPTSAGLLSLDVVFTADLRTAARVFSTADFAIWPGAEAQPVGAEQAIEATVAPTWRVFMLNGDAERSTGRPAVRRAVRAMTSVLLTESDADAGPFGFVPTVSTVSTSTARALLSADGWLASVDGSRRRGGRDLVIGVSAGSPTSALGTRLEALNSGLEAVGAVSTLDAVGDRYFGSLVEDGTLWSGDFDVAYVEMPVGVPAGWAYPFSRAAAPTTMQPSAPGFQRVDDEALDVLGERIAGAGSPEEAATLMREALVRAEGAAYVIWDEPVRARYLTRGIDGASAHPLLGEVLTTAGQWKARVVER
jgi:hypothetical protein